MTFDLRLVTRRRASAVGFVAALGAVAIAALASGQHRANADTPDADGARFRCATRLSITLLGQTADPTLVASPAPLDAVPQMVLTPAFSDRYASFVNARFNGGPPETIDQEVIYYLAKYVIDNDKPWKDLFVGQYNVKESADKQSLDVVPDPNGLGYFRTVAWSTRYAGNEDQGLRIASAYRMISNTTATQIIPSVGQPNDDRTVTGRLQQPCAGCHFEKWYALDKAADLLTKKVVDSKGNVTFSAAPASAPQQLLGKTLTNDHDLVQTLVDSDAFLFGQCRNVFRFLFGRDENTCEAPVFDKCVDALKTKGTIRAAVTAVAQDPVFCQ